MADDDDSADANGDLPAKDGPDDADDDDLFNMADDDDSADANGDLKPMDSPDDIPDDDDDDIVMMEDVDMSQMEDISLTDEEMIEVYGDDAVADDEDAEAILSNFKTLYPQCKMFRNMNNGAVSLSYNGALHYIPNLATYKNLFHAKMWGKWINQPHGQYIGANHGNPMKPGTFLGKGDASPAVYLVSHRGHHIVNAVTFNRCGFDWKKIKVFPQAKVNAYPKGADIDATLY